MTKQDDEGKKEEVAVRRAPTRTRRRALKRVGLGAVGLGLGVVLGVPLVKNLTGAEPPPMTGEPQAAPVRLDHVTVIDPRDGSSHADMSVLMRNGTIAAVSPTVTATATRDAWVIDGAGRFAVPGYNNMHTHVLQSDRSGLHMATMLAEGTTGMRQMAGSSDLLRYRDEGRLPLGINAPALLSMPGDLLMPWNAGSVEEVRDEITRQKVMGADFIKLIQVDRDVFFEAVSWAHREGLKIAGHLPPGVSPREAAEAGLDSLEHLGTGSDIWIETSSERTILRTEEDTGGPLPSWIGYVPFAGKIFASDLVEKVTGKMLLNPALVDSPDDVAMMARALNSFDRAAADDLAQTFARNSTWQTPTLVRLRTQFLADDPEYDNHPWLTMLSPQSRDDYREMRAKFLALPAESRATYHRCYEMSQQMVKLMHDAGVPIMTGTDGPGGNPGQDLSSEFRELAAAGIQPLDILRSTTTVPAAYLGRSAIMGAVAPGMVADLVLLDADPLQDVNNMTRIAAVVRAGHFLPRPEIESLIDELAHSVP
jgi:Amidohydrolase family